MQIVCKHAHASRTVKCMNKYTYQIELSTLTGEVEAETQQQAEQEVLDMLWRALKKKKFVFNNSVIWVAQRTPKVQKGRFIEHK